MALMHCSIDKGQTMKITNEHFDTLAAMVNPLDTPEKRAAFKASIPWGRLSTPHDIGNAAVLLQPREQGRHGPSVAMQFGRQMRLHHARNILDQATAGDVYQTAYFHRTHQR
jgi:hypothetical protein